MSRQRILKFPSSIHNYHNLSALHILQRPLWPSPMIPLSSFHLQGRHFTPAQSISTQFQQPRSSLPANPTHPNLWLNLSFSVPFPFDEEAVGSSSRYDFHSYALEWSWWSAGKESTPCLFSATSRTGAGVGAEGNEEELDSGRVKIGWEILMKEKKSKSYCTLWSGRLLSWGR